MGSLTMSTTRPPPSHWMLVILLLSLCSLSTQSDPNEEIQDPDAPEEINTLQTETGLSISQAFRCGIFIVNPADDHGLPLTDLKVFPALFDAKEECEAEKPNVKRYNDHCSGLMEKIKKKKNQASEPEHVQEIQGGREAHWRRHMWENKAGCEGSVRRRCSEQ